MRCERPPDHRAIAAWTAALVLHRVAVLMLGFDGTYYWEESFRVLAATSIWRGWGLSLYDLQADPYAGGSLVMSVLAVPAVAVFGPTLTALKLTGIAWTAAGFMAWMVLAWKHVGRAAAHGFAALFVLAPPLFLLFNLLVMGSHWETVTLAGLQWLLVAAYVRDEPAKTGRLVAWGVVAGLGIWFTYVSALVLAAGVVFALAGGRLPARRWPLLALAVLAGLLPWIAYNLATTGSGLAVVVRTFMPLEYAGEHVVYWYLAAVSDLLKKALPRALRFEGGALIGYVYWAVAWSCVAAAAVSTVRSRELGLVGALVFFLATSLLVVAGSEHTFQVEFAQLPFLTYRVLVPILPPLFLVCAAVLTARRSAVRAVALGVLVALGVAGTIQVAGIGASRRTALDAAALGTGAEVMGHLLVYKRGDDMAAIGESVGRLPKELQGAAARGVGFALAYRMAFEPSLSLESLLSSIEREDLSAADAIEGMRLALTSGREHVPAVPSTPGAQALRDALRDLDRPTADP